MSSKKRRCNKKIIKKDFIEDIVISAAISIFSGNKHIDRIVDTCFSLQNTEGAELPALRKQLKK